jgi:hypothetical protein
MSMDGNPVVFPMFDPESTFNPSPSEKQSGIMRGVVIVVTFTLARL